MKQMFGMGIRVLTASEAKSVDLGPLNNLKGTWTGAPFMGWNVISVPGPKPDGFILEVIPYEETLSFTPVVSAGNRGPFVKGKEQNQVITGLLYEQTITSVCGTSFCKERGFKKGTIIHAERGMFLNVQNFNEGFNVARLSTIPHGNSLLALGKSSAAVPKNNNFFGSTSSLPFPVGLGYGEDQFLHAQFKEFNQVDPNTFLRKTLGDQKVLAMTTLNFSTKNNGGILNIPFIEQHINTTMFDATFWVQKIKGSTPGQRDFMQLQYTQTINLVFPATGDPAMINWPHVTINTLTKTA
jgi:hypothetical protein